MKAWLSKILNNALCEADGSMIKQIPEQFYTDLLSVLGGPDKLLEIIFEINRWNGPHGYRSDYDLSKPMFEGIFGT